MKSYEVIIVGGSYAGLSAAMALGRSLRHVLIIDSGNPCNKQTPHSHNFITQDGETPSKIAAKAKEQVLNYKNVQFIEDVVVNGKKLPNGFEILTKSLQKFTSKKLVLAMGIKDVLPKIKGFEACWGITAIHCPYCHGYEFKNEKTGILANGDQAMHLLPLVHNLTKNLTLLTQGKPDITEQQRTKLIKNNVGIRTQAIVELIHENGHLKTILFEDGSIEHFTALYAQVPFKLHSNFPMEMGCQLDETGRLQVNPFQQTNIKGIYACGDLTSRMRSVAYASATGNIVGAMVNMELANEVF
ncbi:pyridine nucleotide-disulfide oxidoreductase [Croceivirga radicis]|uniref:Pyridine nucleotide-disulfide oxidoreductase n=1 Tax=Croceivirga radicis TaxID=1929488 RepID=A0A1V6LPB5_9FLAO|nr:NAD(P)/FAD-dependent oxidoreductase [Croceivirga radicis]OQD41949.1 pyridine nucleotide-disulfide oxidoreductase [Croceivirga radicis]